MPWATVCTHQDNGNVRLNSERNGSRECNEGCATGDDTEGAGKEQNQDEHEQITAAPTQTVATII